ncbi:MAG: hypothetical protein EU529_09470 [Promethearchaeota archaeon]|nr:MAG: hypothetical protein EU529_09470 [Candidatus Lokiarchaeota archaeon]
MENFNEKNFNMATLMRIYFKPKYTNIFQKIKEINTPESPKNNILMILLDGQWHSENEIIRITRKQHGFMGTVTLQVMISNINKNLTTNYLQKRIVNGNIYYKLSDNYILLTRAAYTKYRFIRK